jgi:hypothetical protein
MGAGVCQSVYQLALLPMTWGLIPFGDKGYFSSPKRPAFYSVDTGGFLLVDQRQECEADHSHLVPKLRMVKLYPQSSHLFIS